VTVHICLAQVLLRYHARASNPFLCSIAVIWRKCCFGTESGAGSLFVARMLTVIETALRRGVHVLDCLVQACCARTVRIAPPTLQFR